MSRSHLCYKHYKYDLRPLTFTVLGDCWEGTFSIFHLIQPMSGSSLVSGSSPHFPLSKLPLNRYLRNISPVPSLCQAWCQPLESVCVPSPEATPPPPTIMGSSPWSPFPPPRFTHTVCPAPSNQGRAATRDLSRVLSKLWGVHPRQVSHQALGSFRLDMIPALPLPGPGPQTTSNCQVG